MINCQPTQINNKGVCDNCADGQVPNSNQTACKDCLPTQITKNGACEDCKDEKVPNFDQTECTAGKKTCITQSLQVDSIASFVTS